MRILAYQKSVATRIESGDLLVVISPFAGAREAIWDDVDPADADYILAPFTFKVRVPGNGGHRTYNGSDILRPGVLRAVAADYRSETELRTSIVRTYLGALPLYERFPEKHVFIDNGDLEEPCPILCDSVLFKTNATYRYSQALPMPYPVPDPGPPAPITEAGIDVSFLGHVPQHPIRERLAAWSRRQTALTVEFRATQVAFHTAEPKRQAEMARENFELMLRSRFVLSPRGTGPTSRRFFEILAHGRIPVHIGDSARLPLEPAIEYDRFVVRVPEGFVSLTAGYIREFLCRHDLAEASELARRTYLDYFAPRSFRRFVEASLAGRHE